MSFWRQREQNQFDYGSRYENFEYDRAMRGGRFARSLSNTGLGHVSGAGGYGGGRGMFGGRSLYDYEYQFNQQTSPRVEYSIRSSADSHRKRNFSPRDGYGQGGRTERGQSGRAERGRGGKSDRRRGGGAERGRGGKREHGRGGQLSVQYYFENGFRKVYPYYFTFHLNCQKKWEGQKLLDVFVEEFPTNTRENYIEAIESGSLLINSKSVPVDYALKKDDSISSKTHRHEDPVLDLPIEIIYEDRDMLVVNKPAGIPCNPSGRHKTNSARAILQYDLGLPYLQNMYHLDWQSSGIMVFAKNSKTLEVLEHQVHNGFIRKEFVARVEGEFPYGKITVDNPQEIVSHKLPLWKISPSGKPSTTVFERLSYNGKSSVVRCIPEVGRTAHQIRVHLQYMGHPIINDPVYSSEVWGKNKGKGGNYERPLEEVVEELTNSTKPGPGGEWLEEANPVLVQKKAMEDAGKDKEGCANEDCETAGNEAEAVVESESETNIDAEAGGQTEEEDADLIDKHDKDEDESGDQTETAMETSDCLEPQAKKAKTDVEQEDTKESADKQIADTVYSYYKRQGQKITVQHKAFELSKWNYSEHCAECHRKYVNPNPESLVLYLHAKKFEGPDWKYYCKSPEWARDDWKEPENDC